MYDNGDCMTADTYNERIWRKSLNIELYLEKMSQPESHRGIKMMRCMTAVSCQSACTAGLELAVESHHNRSSIIWIASIPDFLHMRHIEQRIPRWDPRFLVLEPSIAKSSVEQMDDAQYCDQLREQSGQRRCAETGGVIRPPPHASLSSTTL